MRLLSSAKNLVDVYRTLNMTDIFFYPLELITLLKTRLILNKWLRFFAIEIVHCSMNFEQFQWRVYESESTDPFRVHHIFKVVQLGNRENYLNHNNQKHGQSNRSKFMFTCSKSQQARHNSINGTDFTFIFFAPTLNVRKKNAKIKLVSVKSKINRVGHEGRHFGLLVSLAISRNLNVKIAFFF